MCEFKEERNFLLIKGLINLDLKYSSNSSISTSLVFLLIRIIIVRVAKGVTDYSSLFQKGF